MLQLIDYLSFGNCLYCQKKVLLYTTTMNWMRWVTQFITQFFYCKCLRFIFVKLFSLISPVKTLNVCNIDNTQYTVGTKVISFNDVILSYL